MLVKTQYYADQSDVVQARVSGNKSVAGRYTPIFMKEAGNLSMIG
ncbi:MAG: hypothetical protein N0E55_01825 [Candidatus Thiodiazotropha taylori]|nr:hypothetical protein [Candidatus Thiodiazotropha taylori]MCW4282345.1 hypothetical protein [Candidatus Thiodiazotropha taylori]